MARVKVELNSPGMASLLHDAGIRDDLTRRAEAVRAAAVNNAPVDTGRYRAGIHIVQDSTDRVAVRVVAAADHSWAVEATTGNLARSLDAAGGS